MAVNGMPVIGLAAVVGLVAGAVMYTTLGPGLTEPTAATTESAQMYSQSSGLTDEAAERAALRESQSSLSPTDVGIAAIVEPGPPAPAPAPQVVPAPKPAAGGRQSVNHAPRSDDRPVIKPQSEPRPAAAAKTAAPVAKPEVPAPAAKPQPSKPHDDDHDDDHEDRDDDHDDREDGDDD